jgi:hypothetical protein
MSVLDKMSMAHALVLGVSIDVDTAGTGTAGDDLEGCAEKRSAWLYAGGVFCVSSSTKRYVVDCFAL